MSDYKTRLHMEYSDVMQRLGRLKDFILSDTYETLPDMDKLLLKEQLGHMQGYFNVLSRRVSRLCG